ncbi:MAG: hypothetical protein RLZZ502_1399 [Pseudomonadota bacterium]
MLHKPFLLILGALFALISGDGVAQTTTTITVQKRYTIAPTGASSYRELEVACPTGYTAMSGGIDHNEFEQKTIWLAGLAPVVGSTPTFLLSNGQYAGPSGYIAAVSNVGLLNNTVTITATCARLTANVVTVVASMSTTAASNASPTLQTATALCPSGYAAVGGGGDFAQPGVMTMAFNAPRYTGKYTYDLAQGTYTDAPIGWSVGIRSTGASALVKYAAVCVQGLSVTSVVSALQNVNVNISEFMTPSQMPSCPSGTNAIGGGIDTIGTTHLILNGSTPVYSGLSYPSDLTDGQKSAPSFWGGGVQNFSTSFTASYKAVILCGITPAISLYTTVNVIEFYNSNIKHYFRTASAAEAAGIDAGNAGPGWVRTGDNFTAYAAGQGLGLDVCRFYTFGANSHFYTSNATECAGLKAPNTGWVYESLAFRIPQPAVSGCAAGQTPVYRLYNNRFAFNDSNHRFTTRQSEINSMTTQGWVLEGIAMCAV